MKTKRNNRGITLISLTLYIIVLMGVIAILSVFKANIDEKIDSMGEYTSLVPEFNKMHMYMLGELNTEDNKIVKRSADGTYIEFSSGNYYQFSDNKVYKNSTRVLSNVNSCSFVVGTENNSNVLYVNLSVGEEQEVNKNLKYVMNTENEIILPEVDINQKIVVGYSDKGPTNEDVYVTLTNNSGDDTLTIKYQIGSTTGAWSDYTDKIKMEGNGTIYAALSDDTTKTVEAIVNNIDKEKPNEFDLSVTTTTNSITVTGETTDKGSVGELDEYVQIKGYQFQLLDKDGNIVVDWTDIQKEGTYTFKTITAENITIEQGKEYKVNMKAVDLAGNETDASNNGQIATTGTVADSETAIGVKYSEENATQNNVIVTLEDNSNNSELTLKYQINGTEDGKWTEYTEAIEMEENGIINARLFDNEEQFTGTVVAEVANIDREKPNEFSLTATSTSNSITVSPTQTVTDKGSTGTASKFAQIGGYQFQLLAEDGTILVDWTEKQTEDTYTFTSNANLKIEQGKAYKVNMKAIDLAGNEREATNANAGIEIGSVPSAETSVGVEITTADGTVINTDDIVSETLYVELTNNSGDDNLTIQYQVNGTEDGKWIEYTDKIPVEENQTINVRLYDETGQFTGTLEIVINNIDKEKPNEFNLTADSTTYSITVSGQTTDKGSTGTASEYIGISGYQYKLTDENGNILVDWTEKQEGTSYTFSTDNPTGLTIEQGTTYKVSMKAIDLAGNERTATNNELEVTTKNVADSESSIGVKITKDDGTEVDKNASISETIYVELTNNSGDNDLTIKYQIDGTDGEWIEYTDRIPVDENGTIYVRLYDEAGQHTGTLTITINNIDKEMPNEFNLKVEATTYSITVSGQTTDKGSTGVDDKYIGISGYQYKLTDENGNVLVDWTTKQEGTSYTFSTDNPAGLTIEQGKTYKVSMKAIDLSGNERGATNNGESVTVGTVADSEDTIEVKYTKADGTVITGNEPLSETIYVELINKSGNDDLTIKYQIDETDGEWIEYTDKIKVEGNETIYVRLYDEAGQHTGTLTITINNIDKEKPNAFDLTADSTASSITVTGETTDKGSTGTASQYVGISGYQFKLTDENGAVLVDWTEKQEGTSYTFSTNNPQGLTIEQGTTYKVSMKAIDLAGNERDATNNGYEVTTKTVASAENSIGVEYTDVDGNVISITDPISGDIYVELTNNSGDDDLIIKYQIGGTAGEWTEYTDKIKIEGNETIYVRLYDEAGQFTGTLEIVINNIDKEKPNTFDLEATSTENTITVTGETTDKGSTGTDSSNIGIRGYQFQLKSEDGTVLTDWTTVQENGSYTFTGLEEVTTYLVNMKAIDFAGNEREATNNNCEITTLGMPNVYVALYTDGTLAFSNKESAFDTTLVSKSYGNIKNKIYWGSKVYNELISGFTEESTPWKDDSESIVAVRFLNEIRHISTARWFFNLKNLVDIDFTNLNTSDVVYMNNMFAQCSSLTELDLSSFNTRNVQQMDRMFHFDNALTSINLSSFETDNVISMSYMFYNCSELQTLDVTPLETGNVTNMSYMFTYCRGLTTLDLTKFDTGKVTSMMSMFEGCSTLIDIDLSSFETNNVTNMSSMFRLCSKLTEIDLTPLETQNVTNMSYMFSSCGLNKIDLTPLETGNVTNMSYMFSNSKDLTNIDLTPLETGSVINMSYMFSGCEGLISLNLTSFDTSNVTNMASMFCACTALTSLDVSSFDTNKVTDMSYMFVHTSSLNILDVSNFDTSNVINMEGMFAGTRNGQSSNETPKLMNLTEIKGLENFNTLNVTNMSYMFAANTSLKVLDLSSFDTRNVQNMTVMFSDNDELTTIYVRDLWSTAAVTSSSSMFYNCLQLVGAVAYSADNANDATFANYTTGYFTWKINDNEVPNEFNLTATSTGDSITVTGSTTDKGEAGIAGYQFQLKSENGTILIDWIDLQESGEYTFTDLDSTTIYLVSMKAIDKAGNETEATNKDTEIATTMPDVYVALYTDGTLAFSNKESAFDTTLVSKSYGNIKNEVYSNQTDMATPWNSDVISITKVRFLNKIRHISTSYWFAGCTALVDIDFTNLDTSDVTNMNSMFYNCSALTNLDVSAFKTSKVEDMGFMFYCCKSLTSLDLDGWDTSNVTAMYYMFSSDGNSNPMKLTEIKGIENFDTSKVTSMSGMFRYCANLTNLKFTNWDTSEVLNFSGIFSDCKSLTELDITELETNKATNMSSMFSYCQGLTSLDFSAWNTAKVTNMSGMFEGTKEISMDLSLLDTSLVTNMSFMFSYSKASKLDLTKLDVSNVENFSGMFFNNYYLTDINISNWDTSKATNMSSMFLSCSWLETLDLSSFNTSKVTNMSQMFWQCSGLTTIYVRDLWSTAAVTSSSSMFTNCSNLVGAVAYSADNANDATFANYTTGYLTHKGDAKKMIEVEYSETELTKDNVDVTLKNVSAEDDLTIKYQIDSTSGTWIEYTEPIEMTQNGVIYVRLYDENENYLETGTLTINIKNIDKLDPTIASVAASNVEVTTFTLTATGMDQEESDYNACSGIGKYEFYINNVLENTVTTTEGTAIWNVTGKTGGNTYKVKVIVYDAVGNSKTSDEISVTTNNPDNTPPTIQISATYDTGSSTGYGGYYFTVNVTSVSDDVAMPAQPIYKYYYKEQSMSDYELFHSGTETSKTLDAVSLQPHKFKVEVADAAGNIGTSNIKEVSTCFVAGTKVLTEDGLINIEDVKVGMNVYSKNEITGEVELKPVTDTHKNYVDFDMCKVYINGEYIECTSGHSFYEVNKGWIEACELEEGDLLLNSNNEQVKVEKVEYIVFNGEKLNTVYNLTVEDNHNYYVGEESVLVHNDMSCHSGGAM